MNRLMTVMGACAEPAFVQLAMTPTPALFERYAKRVYKRHEAHLSRERREHLRPRPLDGRGRRAAGRPRGPAQAAVLRRSARDRPAIAPLRADRLRAARGGGREPPRRARHRGASRPARPLRPPRRSAARAIRCRRFTRACIASTELAALWHLPSIDYATVPFARSGLPLAPAPPAIMRPGRRAWHAARCARRRSRSIRSCAARTPPCPARSSRASPAISWPRSPRICAASAAR